MTEAAAPVPTDSAGTSGGTGGDVVAPPSSWERKKFLLISLIVLGWGWWSLYDGFVKWPADNQRVIDEARAAGKPIPERLEHNDLGIFLNKLIGITFQPLGLLLLWYTFYRSRGEYRLSGETLQVPGHPPVPFDAIRAIDWKKWKRKGIAYIEYEVAGKPGRLKLDDYVYEQDPTDEIYKRVLNAVAPEEAKAQAEEEAAEKAKAEAEEAKS